MDPFESLDDAAAAANDEVLSAAVAEVNACYDELARNIGDSKMVFDRLNKAAAIVRGKLAERDAKREAESGLSSAEINQIKNHRVQGQVEDFKKKFDEMALRASEGDETAECFVQMKAEVEAAYGGEKMEDIIKRFL